MRYDYEVGVYGKPTECKCPKCGKKHKQTMKWIGRGVPRKFCSVCALYVSDQESAETGGIVATTNAFGWSLRLVMR